MGSGKDFTPPTGFAGGLNTSLHLLTGKWKPLLVYFLLLGSKRYGELKRAVRDASDKVLIQQHKERATDRVVIRTDHKKIPRASITRFRHWARAWCAGAAVPLGHGSCGGSHQNRIGAALIADRHTWYERGHVRHPGAARRHTRYWSGTGHRGRALRLDAVIQPCSAAEAATSEGRKSLPLRVATDGMSATLARQPASRSGVLLRRYIDTFRLALESGNRTRLCGIMGAGHDDLPEAVKTGIGAFADMNEAWLSRVLEGSIAREGGSAGQRASAIYVAILGAQIVARSRDDISLFDRAISCYHATGLLPQEMPA